MGYATTYKLKWSPLSEASTVPQYELDDQISSYIRGEQQKNDEFMYGVTPDGETSDSCKWYEHEEDLKPLSKKFPDVMFTLFGEGEESGDIWRKYLCLSISTF